MDVSIIIINYNTFSHTCNCINSIIQFTSNLKYEIILVDNASDESLPEKFKEIFPEIILLKSENNLGFSKGNNLGISKAKGKYILLLNSDIILTENSIYKSFQQLMSKPKIGALTIKLKYPDGRIQSNYGYFPSIWNELLTFIPFYRRIIPDMFKNAFKIPSNTFHAKNFYPDYIWGAYFMFPAEIIKKLPEKKLFDKFFMYAEDLTWCKQIKNLNYEIFYFSETSAIHIHFGSSSETQKPHIIEMNTLNEMTFLKLFYPSGVFKAIIFLRSIKFALLSLKNKDFDFKLYWDSFKKAKKAIS
jgi:GT2 family glycosyltransferase